MSDIDDTESGKRYVTIMGTDGKIAAVGKILSYHGKWIKIWRNDNEIVLVNSDKVMTMHFMEVPTRAMRDAMEKSAPVVDDTAAQHERQPIATKHSSGRIGDRPLTEGDIQALIDEGPPGSSFEGAGISVMPRQVKLPKGVSPDDIIFPESAPESTPKSKPKPRVAKKRTRSKP